MTRHSHTAIDRVIEQVFAESWATLLGTLVRYTRDFDAAEDALQDAIARAIDTWTRDGVPPNPAGWLATTARNIVIDGARRSQAYRARLPLLIVDAEPGQDLHSVDFAFGDDRLRLIFTCCHPVLPTEARIALTLRMVCGLTTAEIAHLFLVPEPTMAARITRAKKKLAASGVPYRIPLPADLPTRLNDVLTVIYLVATEAHTPSSGTGLLRDDHMQLALRLSHIMCEHVPHNPEVLGLHAIILFADARKHARVDAAGNALTLDAMDRSLWNPEHISAGLACTAEAMRRSTPENVGPFALQAAIAAIHAEAYTYDDTDWPQIVALYTLLEQRQPTAIVRLGKSIALGMRDGADVGLRLVSDAAFDDALPTYPMLPAARADFSRRVGDYDSAITQYTRAAELTTNDTLRIWFLNQATTLQATEYRN